MWKLHHLQQNENEYEKSQALSPARLLAKPQNAKICVRIRPQKGGLKSLRYRSLNSFRTVL